LTDAIMEYPLAYRLWQAPFVDEKIGPILRHTDMRGVRRVLDVGCGPGTNARLFEHADYIGIDINARCIEYARRRFRGSFIVADATTYQVPAEEKFDLVLVNSFLHHIPTEAVHRVLAHLRTLLAPGGSVHALEVVLPAEPSVARLLARLDRGKFTRPVEEWKRLFGADLRIDAAESVFLRRAGVTLWHMMYLKGSAPA
jgi:SAM-dependent methyltransferase